MRTPFFRRSVRSLLASLCWAILFGADAALVHDVNAGEPSADERAAIEHFEKHVRPVLVDRCEECHSGEEPESDLGVDSLAALLRGGMRGPAIVPGKAEESLLIRSLRHSEQLKMPLKSKLPADEIAAIARWIDDGAVWPNAEPVVVKSSNADPLAVNFTDDERAFWAFQPPVASSLPAVANTDWMATPIDAFVLSKLEENGLSPAPPADRRTLIRRATFDLLGLPPTPEEVAAFVADESPDAFERLVDRLLASPQYGERWGRHWLDVARYGDSNGLDENLAYANAFRYRDYVVAAFNENIPFDQFVAEQIAGDLMNDGSAAGPVAAAESHERLRRITATGFLCLGPKMLAEDDPVKLQMDLIDEQIDTVGRVFLGMTMGCARCHDHKFDPIPMSDYYSLAGIFKSTQTMDTLTVVAQWHERPLATPEAIAARAEHQQQLDEATAAVTEFRSRAVAEIQSTARRHVGDYLLAAEASRRERKLLAETPAAGDDPKATETPGAIFREAESFDRGNVQRDTTNYGAGIGVLVNQGPTPNFVEYDIESPTAGTYRLEVRYAAAAARPCTLAINGRTVSASIADGVTGTWFPDSQRWEVEGFFHLEKGKNVVRLEHPQFFPHIDKLLLLPAPEAGANQADRLHADYRPLDEFVVPWEKHLEAIGPESESPLRYWRRLAETASDRGELDATTLDDVAGGLAELGIDVELLRADAAPSGLHRLAAAFERLINDSQPESPLRKSIDADDGPFAATASVEGAFPDGVKSELASLRAEEKKLRETMPALPHTMAVEDAKVEEVAIHYRGSHLTLGPVTPRRFPRILAGEVQPPIGQEQSGRRELAEWMASPDNPLTARVFVNRVWQAHFGHGLVRSPDNFGRLGERPTHPELLDWLAVRFMESGWDVKRLHREIMRSSVWRMSVAGDERAAAIDPENRLLSRMNRRRLEAEAIRDSILSLSGRLDRTMGGSLLPTENRKYVTSTANVDPVVYVTDRRSIYLPVVRSALFDVFQAFDFADPNVVSGQRQTTTVAPQALFMMNSLFVAEHTKTAAERLLSDLPDDAARFDLLWRTAFGRLPTDDERTRSARYVEEYAARWSEARPEAASEAPLRAWQSLCRIVVASNEFVFVE